MCAYANENNQSYTAQHISAGVRSICCSDNRLITNADAAFFVFVFVFCFLFCFLAWFLSLFLVLIFFPTNFIGFLLLCFPMFQHLSSEMLSLLFFHELFIFTSRYIYRICDVVISFSIIFVCMCSTASCAAHNINQIM